MDFTKTDIIKLFKGKDLHGGWVYAATYGIGVNLPLNYRIGQIDDIIQNVLKYHNIAFKCEHSEKKRVLRYVLSKSKTNIGRIKISLMTI